MSDYQEHEEQTRKLDQFHDRYHQQKPPGWLKAEAEVWALVHPSSSELTLDQAITRRSVSTEVRGNSRKKTVASTPRKKSGPTTRASHRLPCRDCNETH